MASKLEILIKFAEELRKQRDHDITDNPQYKRLQQAFAKALRVCPEIENEFVHELGGE